MVIEIHDSLHLLGRFEKRDDRYRVTGQDQSVSAFEDRVQNCLIGLHRTCRVEFECLLAVSRSNLVVSLDLSAGVEVTVDINIYGSESSAERAGEQLADAGLFLQEPLWKRSDVIYRNPQSLDLAQFEGSNVDIEPTVPWLSSVTGSASNAKPASHTLDQERPAYKDVIDNYAEHAELVQADVNERIRTSLLK